eukprot:TRINITY_DN1845_c0_g1_i1.p1 TRINITY_DN1845_c0_g1~~TRINITY_DN1845_c0_g1_i1.p1  ORF type:complete len:137 (-),score=2.46 TRINITY_DN1845_c0_g1_i1:4-414(-)
MHWLTLCLIYTKGSLTGFASSQWGGGIFLPKISIIASCCILSHYEPVSITCYTISLPWVTGRSGIVQLLFLFIIMYLPQYYDPNIQITLFSILFNILCAVTIHLFLVRGDTHTRTHTHTHTPVSYTHLTLPTNREV